MEMCETAFKKDLEVHPMRLEGTWTASLAHLPSPRMEYLARAATQVGTVLGLAVALWNDLGRDWKDLWDYYRELDDDVGGFLPFFRNVTEALLDLGPQARLGDMTNAFLGRVEESLGLEREAFLQGSLERSILSDVVINGTQLETFARAFRRWGNVTATWRKSSALGSDTESASSAQNDHRPNSRRT
jgi:hypothetical protein